MTSPAPETCCCSVAGFKSEMKPISECGKEKCWDQRHCTIADSTCCRTPGKPPAWMETPECVMAGGSYVEEKLCP